MTIAAATTDWLPGFEKLDLGPDGGTWSDQTSPWRLVLHSTEGSWAGSLAALDQKDVPPHLMVDPIKRKRAQFVSLNRSSYALENDKGGVETNRVRTVQVEIVGFARQMHLLPEEAKRWLAEEVIAPILAATPIKPWCPSFYGEGAGWVLAREDSRQRMSFEAWLAFDGICGHQHVPENAHWDPGALDVAGILRYLPTKVTTMGNVIHSEVLDGSVGPWPGGRWTTYVVTDSGRVDVLNDVTALDGLSDLWHGDARGLKLAAPIVGFAQTGGGRGYYLVAADGGIFTYGDAVPFKDGRGRIGMAGQPLASPIIGLSVLYSADGRPSGYVMVAGDGGCFQFGAGAVR